MTENAMTKNPKGNPAHTVRGRVIHPDGSPVAGEHVHAYAKRLRCDDEPLDKPARTDEDGRYVIEYGPGKRRSVDLYVQVRCGKKVLATSAVVMGAGAEATLDLVIGGAYRGPSEHERLGRMLAPILDDEGIKAEELADFDEHDLALLSARSGVDPRELVLLKQSAALAKETGLPAELFYGLGRQKVPLSLPAILAQDPVKRRAAAKAALDAGEIPARMADEMERGLDKLEALTVEEALRDPRLPGETTLGGLLEAAGLSPAKRKKLVAAYVKHDGSNEAFWKNICATRGFSQAEVDRVQRTLQLGAVTQNHLPLVRALQARHITDLKDLARLDEADWLGLVRGEVEGRQVGLPAHLQAAGLDEQGYASMMFRIVEQAFPTAMVAHRSEVRGMDLLPHPEALRERELLLREPDTWKVAYSATRRSSESDGEPGE